jgi:hypothetical protein
MKRLFILCISFLILNSISSQTKSTEHFSRLWLGGFSQIRLSNKWGIWSDIHLRTKENVVNNLSQGMIRVGVMYYLNDATRLSVGYAFVNDFPSDNHKNISIPEHRPWQQIQWFTKYSKNRMMQWIRLEERFRRKILNDDALADGYNFNFRVRYNFWYEVPFYKDGLTNGSLSFIANDEVHINFGKQIVNNYFDQNRFFLGVKYQIHPNSNVQFGYMNQFQQLAAGNKYRSVDALRIFYFQNFDLRKKASPKK